MHAWRAKKGREAEREKKKKKFSDSVRCLVARCEPYSKPQLPFPFLSFHFAATTGEAFLTHKKSVSSEPHRWVARHTMSDLANKGINHQDAVRSCCFMIFTSTRYCFQPLSRLLCSDVDLPLVVRQHAADDAREQRAPGPRP